MRVVYRFSPCVDDSSTLFILFSFILMKNFPLSILLRFWLDKIGGQGFPIYVNKVQNFLRFAKSGTNSRLRYGGGGQYSNSFIDSLRENRDIESCTDLSRRHLYHSY